MAKISSYTTTTPVSSDLLIGTDVADSNKTKNFSVGDLAAVVGTPRVKIVDLNSTEILNLTGGGVTNLYTLLDPPGVGKAYNVTGLKTLLTFGTVAYDFTGDLVAGFNGTLQYLIPGTFTIQKEAINTTISYAAGWLPSESTPAGGLITIRGGVILASNTGLTLTAATGANVTQGDGTLKVRMEYQLIETATLNTIAT
tara:strand:- start:3 stop:596 length:594 start_codon:yes stop_codon:yes gene_type:complete